jgi:hypothetical protein
MTLSPELGNPLDEQSEKALDVNVHGDIAIGLPACTALEVDIGPPA